MPSLPNLTAPMMMLIGTGTPAPCPVGIVVVAGKPGARAQAVGGHEFLVIEDSTCRHTLLVIAGLPQRVDNTIRTTPGHGVTTPTCVGDGLPMSPGLLHAQPPFAMGSKKCTCPFSLTGVTGFLRSFHVSVVGTITSYSPSRYIHSFHYPRYFNNSGLAACPVHCITLSPRCWNYSPIRLFNRSIQTRLLQSQQTSLITIKQKLHCSTKSTSCLKTCPFCSVISTSTTTQHSPFLAESFRNISLYDFDATVILPFRELAWRDKPSSTSHVGFSSVSKIWVHPAHHNFHHTIVGCNRISSWRNHRVSTMV